MKYEIEIPEYNERKGLHLNWENDAEITVEQVPTGVHLKANKDGLITLARFLLTLSQNSIPNNYHIHLDDLNGLEDGSCELIIEKEIEANIC